MIADEREGPPVHPHRRREQELALRIADREILQDHLAVERSVDPPHADLHPVFEFERADLVGHEAPARAGVDQQDDRDEEGDDPQDAQPDPLGDPQRPVGPARAGAVVLRLRLRHGFGHGGIRLVAHQNACPMET